jgi:hypothetical protein
MHKRVMVSALLLTMLFASVSALRVKASETVTEKEGYVRMETTRAIYIVNQVFINRYSNQTLSGLIDDVDERFGKIMNITNWSSEKFYDHKLEVTVDPPSRSNITEGTGGYGSAHIFWGKEFPLTNATAKLAVISLFLHEMVHGITPQPFLTRKWLAEGYAVYLSSEVQVMFNDRSRDEVDGWYVGKWGDYVRNGYIDSFNNKSIQNGGGYYITAWMLNNITETYGWATHERFFASLPDEYLYYMPSFSLSLAEASSYKYYFDSLIVGYYSLATGTSLFSAFKRWGVRFLPNPITIICLNGTREQNHAYTSEVTVSLSAAGENEINKIEYSFDQKTWNTYVEPFSICDNRILYCKSTDSAGNTGPTTLITLTVESNSPTPRQSEPFPTTLIIAASASVVVVIVGLLVYFKKRKN